MLSRRKGYNFLMNAYQTYADTYLIDLVRTNYLRGGCLIKRIKYSSTDKTMEQRKICELNNYVFRLLVKAK